MFAVLSPSGPAWQSGKRVTEQPLFRQHLQSRQQLFAARQLLMGGPFPDMQSALAILDVASVAQVRDIVAHDPFGQARVLEPHLHPCRPPSISLKLRALQQEADGDQSPSCEKLAGGQRKSIAHGCRTRRKPKRPGRTGESQRFPLPCSRAASQGNCFLLLCLRFSRCFSRGSCKRLGLSLRQLTRDSSEIGSTEVLGLALLLTCAPISRQSPSHWLRVSPTFLAAAGREAVPAPQSESTARCH